MRLIDADALANDLLFDINLDEKALDNSDIVGAEREHIQFDKDCKQNCVYYLTETEPIDAVPVIRCKECKHSDAYNHCTRLSIWNKPEDFCSYGERKES